MTMILDALAVVDPIGALIAAADVTPTATRGTRRDGVWTSHACKVRDSFRKQASYTPSVQGVNQSAHGDATTVGATYCERVSDLTDGYTDDSMCPLYPEWMALDKASCRSYQGCRCGCIAGS